MKHIQLFEEFVNEASETLVQQAERLGKIDHYKIDYKLNGTDSQEEASSEEEAIKIGKQLEKDGADYVVVKKYFKQNKFNVAANDRELQNFRLIAYSGDTKHIAGADSDKNKELNKM